jgi:hypothetical protein
MRYGCPISCSGLRQGGRARESKCGCYSYHCKFHGVSLLVIDRHSRDRLRSRLFQSKASGDVTPTAYSEPVSDVKEMFEQMRDHACCIRQLCLCCLSVVGPIREKIGRPPEAGASEGLWSA